MNCNSASTWLKGCWMHFINLYMFSWLKQSKLAPIIWTKCSGGGSSDDHWLLLLILINEAWRECSVKPSGGAGRTGDNTRVTTSKVWIMIFSANICLKSCSVFLCLVDFQVFVCFWLKSLMSSSEPLTTWNSTILDNKCIISSSHHTDILR